MDEQELLELSREALRKGRQIPAAEQLQRLIDKGVIDERGRVLLWDFDLAVVAVKPNGCGVIEEFRCVKPDRNNPGASTINVNRESLKRAIEEGRRVVTAVLNPKQNRWKEGPEVHVTPQGYLRTDATEECEDDLGTLPEVRT